MGRREGQGKGKGGEVGVGYGESTPECTSVLGDVVSSGGRLPRRGGDRGGGGQGMEPRPKGRETAEATRG